MKLNERGVIIIALNRTHLIILSILAKSQATSSATAITTEEMEQFCPIGKSYTTLHRAVRLLSKHEYITQGIKDGKFQTHYITKLGLDLLEEVK